MYIYGGYIYRGYSVFIDRHRFDTYTKVWREAIDRPTQDIRQCVSKCAPSYALNDSVSGWFSEFPTPHLLPPPPPKGKRHRRS